MELLRLQKRRAGDGPAGGAAGSGKKRGRPFGSRNSPKSSVTAAAGEPESQSSTVPANLCIAVPLLRVLTDLGDSVGGEEAESDSASWRRPGWRGATERVRSAAAGDPHAAGCLSCAALGGGLTRPLPRALCEGGLAGPRTAGTCSRARAHCREPGGRRVDGAAVAVRGGCGGGRVCWKTRVLEDSVHDMIWMRMSSTTCRCSAARPN